jgi:preprotein translocase subunit SecF
VKNHNIPFIQNRRKLYLFSLLLFITFTSIAYYRGGINWGIDFSGGVKLNATFEDKVTIHEIRQLFDSNNMSCSVQQVSEGGKNAFSITTKLVQGDATGAASSEKVKGLLDGAFQNVQISGNQALGPAIGDYLKKTAGKMVIYCIIMMTVYLAFRFEFRFSLGAMIALVHDVVLSIALAAACRVEFDIPVLAAILTIFGYSVNDTIVIFDRIRERMQGGSNMPFEELMNEAINQTLSRTVITVLCTLFAVIALFLLGGEVIHGFAIVLLFGITIGCYSSIFIASPVVLGWEKYIRKDTPAKVKK